MKIIKLHSENIKKIKAIEISPDGNIVKITGKNAQGKSSVLDSILYALAGKKTIPDKVIREGEEKGFIELDLGDFIVQRSFTKNDSYLKVLTKEGAEYPKAQDKLSQLVGALSFDPLGFAEYEAKKQREILIELTGVNTTELDNQYKEIYEERAELGILGKQVSGELEGMGEVQIEDQIKRISISETSERLSAFRKEYDEASDYYRTLSGIEDEIEDFEKKVDDLYKRKEELEKINIRDQGEINDDIKKYSEILKEAEKINASADWQERYIEVKNKVEKYREEYQSKTGELERIKVEKDKLIQSAQFPIQGLAFNEDGVTYNNIPFAQLSSAEKLKVSMAMAMAMNPTLRIIRILDGSLLDSENMKVIEEMANDKDYQVWVEIVDETGQLGFYIEDGEVKNNDA